VLANGMTTIGFIGSGHIGGTVARLAVDAGHDVVLSNSRGPETLSDLVAQLGPRARAVTAADAAAAGDIVVVTVPLKAYREVPVEPLRGKVVIDTNNYYPQRDGQIPELDDASTTSSELLQKHLPESHVVKAFNNIYFGHLGSLQRPEGDPERSALAIAGDDEKAKRTVTEFLDSIGYDVYDAGALSEGWRYQPDTPAYGQPYVAPGSEFPGPGHHATAEILKEKLAAAVRPQES
jgi:predicted dinucleotide-binding enzyme